MLKSEAFLLNLGMTMTVAFLHLLQTREMQEM